MTDSDQPTALFGEPRLLTELLSGASIPDAARAAGISEATARRRLRNPLHMQPPASKRSGRRTTKGR